MERFLLEQAPKDGELQPFGESTDVVVDALPLEEHHHEIHLPPHPATLNASTVWSLPEAHPLVLSMLLLKKYELDWLGWTMSTVEHAIEDAFGPVLPVNLSKVMACQLAHTSEGPWTHWEMFLPVCSAFNSVLPDFEQMQVPSAAEATFAVRTLDIIDTRPDPWSTELKRFLSTVYQHDQVAMGVDACAFITVQGHWLDMDRGQILRRWPEVKRTGKAPEGDSMEDEQLRKMLEIELYLDQQRKLLEQQLHIARRLCVARLSSPTT